MICELHERMVTNRRRHAEARTLPTGDAQGRVNQPRRSFT